jgi:hypothetical protein
MNPLESPQDAPTIGEALQNALDLIEHLGYSDGDIHDDLAIAIRKLNRHCKDWMNTEV